MSRAGLLRIAGILLCARATLGCDAKLSLCDITKKACQDDIYYADLRLRGDGDDPFRGPPPMRVITQDQYRQELLQANAQSASTLTDSDRLMQRAENVAFALLGFIDSNGNTSGTTIDDLVANVAAYYSPSSRSVTIIARSNSTRDEQATAMETLAHELIHALQDRELNLQDSANTYDQALARGALVEGDASLYELLFVNELRNDIGAPIDIEQSTIVPFLQQWADRIYSDFSKTGSPLFFPQRIRYPLGALYLASAWSTGGNAAVRRAYGRAPQLSIGFLQSGADIDVRTDCLPPVASAYTPLESYHFGAIYFYAFLRAHGLKHETALSVAQDWRGDIAHVAASSDGQFTAVSWQIELAESPRADVIASLASRGTIKATAGDSSLVITASDSTQPIDWRSASSCP